MVANERRYQQITSYRSYLIIPDRYERFCGTGSILEEQKHVLILIIPIHDRCRVLRSSDLHATFHYLAFVIFQIERTLSKREGNQDRDVCSAWVEPYSTRRRKRFLLPEHPPPPQSLGGFITDWIPSASHTSYWFSLVLNPSASPYHKALDEKYRSTSSFRLIGGESINLCKELKDLAGGRP